MSTATHTQSHTVGGRERHDKERERERQADSRSSRSYKKFKQCGILHLCQADEAYLKLKQNQ